MQLSFASLLSLVILVTSVQALPAQEKRSPVIAGISLRFRGAIFYNIAERGNSDATTAAAEAEQCEFEHAWSHSSH
ncbi:hypothetical protein BJ138DRAFT_1120263 [Hygrophoropsis aurantiaca]|uniref:Uncharacterized protein n=1 Tax=Hygrophoropsis aurantiaca TaxID=72124 RepID=A0ACB7ZRS8_9AGAM|nr:hypothetical protein BJ138DRAFT_1120263 [Hygrophoropsis aurantiaca]